MGTRKSVDQILDTAADILERDGWVTGDCYDSDTGGRCALGAIAQAVYPKVLGYKLDSFAYVTENSDREYENLAGRKKDPRHVAAVEALALQIKRRKSLAEDDIPDWIVYRYNDTGHKVPFRSAQKVINAMRKAAEKYRASAA